MQILDGRLVAQKIRTELKRKINSFYEKNKIVPGLVVILVGDNPASQVYVRQKVKMAKQVGIHSKVLSLPKDVSFDKLKQTIQNLNTDPAIHALLVQLPLPSSLAWKEVIAHIDPRKDPDCLTAENQGLAWSGQARVLPCTPAGIMKLFEHYNITLKGKKAVVVGRSQIVGLPMAQLLLRANATVTVCHSYTKNLSQITKEADLVVAAAGRQGLLGKNDFKRDAIVVDVGIHRTVENNKKILKGDVLFEELKNGVSYATPVPGGVGPMTVTMLLENTFQLACLATESRTHA
ncbi:MAG: bifunctional 5,10-methylenetetrahydrofolate dehydrogenase/5,10-methenyltetrahydrofolate cyclohydrolase [Bdellovibrionales bacterium]|nr:bifunctional 5,10-methylenetetrahydrofolate dehydrogenase/5,10-methenyltetrahydrofolate cyclohydrolase [Bdellovibrionales bacterium]